MFHLCFGNRETIISRLFFRLLHMCVRLKNKRRKIIETAHYDLQCASFVDILQPWMRTSQKIQFKDIQPRLCVLVQLEKKAEIF